MFYNAYSFDADLSKWGVSRVINMRSMFGGARAFNADISKWDVSKVTDMQWMFSSAVAFNQDIANWDVSSVNNMNWMFNFASSFNMDLSSWDVSKVYNMGQMFRWTESFNQILCGKAWVNSYANKKDMFYHSFGSISTTACGAWSIDIIFVFALFCCFVMFSYHPNLHPNCRHRSCFHYQHGRTCCWRRPLRT